MIQINSYINVGKNKEIFVPNQAYPPPVGASGIVYTGSVNHKEQGVIDLGGTVDKNVNLREGWDKKREKSGHRKRRDKLDKLVNNIINNISKMRWKNELDRQWQTTTPRIEVGRQAMILAFSHFTLSLAIHKRKQQSEKCYVPIFPLFYRTYKCQPPKYAVGG